MLEPGPKCRRDAKPYYIVEMCAVLLEERAMRDRGWLA